MRIVTLEAFKRATTLFASSACSSSGLGNADARIEVAADASGLPSRAAQFNQAIVPRSCPCSSSFSSTERASFFHTWH